MPRKILFIHPNFPGQFKHLLQYCAERGDYILDFITEALPVDYPGVRLHRVTDKSLIRPESTAEVMRGMAARGYRPDLVICHSGWGSDLKLPEVFPRAKLLCYPEWYYRSGNKRNYPILKALEYCRAAMVPTRWQKQRFPKRFHHKIRVIHEGIDAVFFKPSPEAVFTYHGRNYSVKDEIITYAARGLEPIRGFPEFMRALPAILRARPEAKVIIAGDDRVCYGGTHPSGNGWRQVLSDELRLPAERVVFCGKLPEDYFLKLLQISSLHVYLSRDFVLSWSMLNAMSCGCLVLGSDTPPVTEVLKNQVNGITCELASSNIAAAVIETLANRNGLKHLREQARREIIEHYNAEDCVRWQYRLIGELLNENYD